MITRNVFNKCKTTFPGRLFDLDKDIACVAVSKVPGPQEIAFIIGFPTVI